jgi:hypothetical protein
MTKRQRTEGQHSTKHTHKTKYRLWLPVHEEEKPFSFNNNNYSASLIIVGFTNGTVIVN